MPPLLQTIAWALAPTRVMEHCARTLGDSWTLTMWPSGLQLAMVSDPEDVKTVFTAPPGLAPSGAGSSPVAAVMGEHSVIVLTGPEHMRQRKLLLPPFHGERMREYEDVIVAATRADMASWPLGEPMRLHEHTRRITLEVIVRAVFGVEAERMGPLRDAIEGFLAPMDTLRMLRFALKAPTMERPTGRFGEGLDAMDTLIYEEIARHRRQDLGERTDILSLLMLARDEDGEAMTDDELRDELVTLLLAGHETTATTVAWAVERLVRHPAALERLIAEVDLAEDDSFCNAVVNETLRVRPVVPLVVRVLTGELSLRDRTLPAGTRVVPNIYLANRNPRVYDAPGEFRPERFLENAPETFSWIPFGGGIRRCIGAAFAQLEAKLILQTALAELRPRLPGGRSRLTGPRRRGEAIRRRAITLVPSAGARVVWERRSAG